MPKYILKRIVPKEALANYDISGDGTPDHVGLKYINVLAPMELPADLTADDLLGQLEGIYVDDEKVDQPERGMILYQDRRITIENIAEFAGETFPVGGQLLILVPYPGGLDPGPHKLRIDTVYQGQKNSSGVERELTQDRACLPVPDSIG